MAGSISAGAMLGSAGIGVGGNILSGLMNFGFSNAGSKRQYHYARDLANLQYQLMQQGYLDSPTNQRLGLEKAGYNPILAVNSGVNYGSPGLGSASPSSATSSSDIGTSASNSYRAFKLEKEQVEAGVNNTNAQTALTNEQTRNAVVQRDLMTLDKISKDLDNQLKKKDLSWYDRLKTQEVQELMTRSKYNVASAVAARMNANASMLNASTNSKIAPSTISLNQANAKYSNERARGFNETWSESFSRSRGDVPWNQSRTNGQSYNRSY